MAQRVGKAPTTVRIIRLPTVRDVLAEAAPLVEFLDPFSPGSRTEPSPVLSLVLKLAMFRLTKKQVRRRGVAVLLSCAPPKPIGLCIMLACRDGRSALRR